MRQAGSEKDNPLKRIQEEINEVARREQELREKMQLQQLPQENGTTTTTTTQPSPSTSPTPSTTADDSAPPSHTTNGKESLDEAHSDDSGISASSSPVNGIPVTEKRYIRPNGYNSIPTPPPQKLLVRTMSTPQIFVPSRKFHYQSGQKGIMQRFIASRGKIAPGQQTRGDPVNPGKILDLNRSFIPPVMITPPIIERDADGRPIRRGYVPVEEKIQRELKDLKNRETELKRMRKLRQSQPDLLDSIEDETLESDDDDSDVEHCFAPGKLRTSKSISELCDSMNTNNSLSPRTTPSPDFNRKIQSSHQNGGLRPAVSLAQLCDLDPDEAPSSHQLIAKWESLIQQNA